MCPETALKFIPPEADTTETELIKRAKTHDKEAFTQLVKQHENKLMGFIMQKTKSEADTKDIIQDTWKKAWKNISDINLNNFKGWIFTIADRTFKDFLKQKKRQRISYYGETAKEKATDQRAIANYGKYEGLNPFEQNIYITELEKVAKNLSERELLILNGVLKGKKLREISEEYGIPMGSVQSTIFRIRKKLKEKDVNLNILK